MYKYAFLWYFLLVEVKYKLYYIKTTVRGLTIAFHFNPITSIVNDYFILIICTIINKTINFLIKQVGDSVVCF